MSLKCVHLADVHFRGLTRHEEYREVFSLAFERFKELKPDVIFVGGDIVHSKTQGISPEFNPDFNLVVYLHGRNC